MSLFKSVLSAPPPGSLIIPSTFGRGWHEVTGEGYEVIQPLNKLDCHADARNDETRHPVLDTGSINVNDSSRFTPHSSHKCAAFTLAEVLITLGIIGIVAALTMPSMIAKHNERQTVVKLKHTYSLLNQAVKMMIFENGELNQWNDGSKEFFEQELKKQLKVIGEQDCPHFTFGKQGLCSQMPNVNHKYVLNNGVVVGVKARYYSLDQSSYDSPCSANISAALVKDARVHYNYCASIFVDLNGRSKPNSGGKDTFEFRAYTDGLLPLGYYEASSNTGFRGCSKDGGTQCTAWVIHNNNMDYLRCRDELHWSCPHSCKEAGKK